MTTEALARELLIDSGCYSVIGPRDKVYFSDAALLWSSFYHLAFKTDESKMQRKWVLAFMVKDGFYYALPLGTAAILLSWLVQPLAGLPLLVVALFCLFFFRDPERAIPSGPVAVSPADGKVVAVLPLEGGQRRVSIFLSPFDVHVNRCPIGGVITQVCYQRGKFQVASREEASAENEQNTLVVDDGQSQVVFKQIAGLIARRIVCDKKVGDRVQMGERFGLIKFGSRMDVILGPEWELAVARGDRVRAGSSVLARRSEERQ